MKNAFLGLEQGVGGGVHAESIKKTKKKPTQWRESPSTCRGRGSTPGESLWASGGHQGTTYQRTDPVLYVLPLMKA